jgi:hypothetical protein
VVKRVDGGRKKKPSLFNSSPEREDAEVASVFKLSDLIPQVLFKSALITQQHSRDLEVDCFWLNESAAGSDVSLREALPA